MFYIKACINKLNEGKVINIIKFQPIIKWSGSKRHLVNEILAYFPSEIDTYYEPFCGGASVMFALLHTNIRFNNVICSDINEELIGMWKLIKENPNEILNSYEQMWNELNKDDDTERRKEYFYEVRKRFNESKKPTDFFFLVRTCTNGLIRYNQKGEFNTSLHFSRKGIDPKRLKKVIEYWNTKLNQFDVKFIVQDYKEIKPGEKDFIYLDPPYANTKGMYYGSINYSELWDWLRNLKCKYILSFNGKRGTTDNTYDVPKDIYSLHKYLKSGRSSFKNLRTQEVEYVSESLYIS